MMPATIVPIHAKLNNLYRQVADLVARVDSIVTQLEAGHDVREQVRQLRRRIEALIDERQLAIYERAAEEKTCDGRSRWYHWSRPSA